MKERMVKGAFGTRYAAFPHGPAGRRARLADGLRPRLTTSPTLKGSRMEKTPSEIEEQLNETENEAEQNLHVSHDAAHLIAEDQVFGGVPKPSSAQVEQERIARAQALDEKEKR
jgi:hypothetical protein